MNTNDFQQFRELIDGVYDFYNRRPNDFHRDVWWQAMQAYDYAAVADAMNRHLMNPDTGQFLPKPADIVKMIRGTTTDSALVAWAKVEESIRKVGPYDSVAFDDPLINRVIQDMGGWIKLCEVSGDELPFKRNEFANRYRGYASRSEVPDYPRALPGIAEHQNVQADLPVQPPKLIGNQERAQRVLEGGSDRKGLEVGTAGKSAMRLLGHRPDDDEAEEGAA